MEVPMRLIELTSPDGPVLIEVSAADQSIAPAGALGDAVVKLQESIAEKLHGLLHVAQAFQKELQQLEHVEKAEIEFGFAVTAKGSVYVVATEAAAAFKVKLSYVPRK
jgi:hypothetical protein